jgi:hypothetical protein
MYQAFIGYQDRAEQRKEGLRAGGGCSKCRETGRDFSWIQAVDNDIRSQKGIDCTAKTWRMYI